MTDDHRHTTFTIPQMAALLGITVKEARSILQDKDYARYFDCVVLDGQLRITKKDFESFLSGQNRFHLVDIVKITDRPNDHETDATASIKVTVPHRHDTFQNQNHKPGQSSDQQKIQHQNPNQQKGHSQQSDQIPNQRKIPGRKSDHNPHRRKTSNQVRKPPSLTADYISLADAAAMANISRQALSKSIARRYFGSVRVGSMIRIHRREFESWLQKHQS